MDQMKPFYTGWASGHELAGQDNQRYTTLNSQALSNTGAMNREMLGHVNDMQSMVFQGKDKFGQPLPSRQKEEMTEFVSKYQTPFSQGVFTPAPWSLPPASKAPIIDSVRPYTPPAPIMPVPVMPSPIAPAADLSTAFAPMPPLQPMPPIVNPGLSSEMQLPPVTAQAMPPIQQGNLTMPEAPPAPRPRRKAKRKVTVKPSNPVTTGNALQPQLSLAR